MMTGCYLIHFSTPYKHAKHYLGWAQDIPTRINAHRQLKSNKNAPSLCPICSGQLDELEIRHLDFTIDHLKEIEF